MRNHCSHALQSGDRSPCKDPTNTPTQETANQAHSSSSLHVPRTPLSNITNSVVNQDVEKPKSGKNWYARMSDEKRAEYNQKRRMARAHKKAASVITINPEEVSQTHASSSPDVPRTPLSNIANSNTTDAAATSAYTDHPSEDVAPGRKKRSSETWYSRQSDEERAEHCKKLRIARLEKKAATTSVQVSPGITYLQTAQSVVSHMLNSPCSGSSMQTDGHIDWLHTNPTYERQTMGVHGVFDVSQAQGAHIQESFLPGTLSSVQMKEASSEKKRRHMREQYDQMTPEEREVVLQRKHVHKMGKRHASSEQSYIAEPTGCHGNGEESYDAGILEPMEPPAEVDECLHDTQDGQPVYDDDECRIFTGQGDEFESYRVTPNVSQQAFAADDPYDYVYKNLPTKHHVLKPVKDCVHCGAMRFQYEGPAFCCRKGKVKVSTIYYHYKRKRGADPNNHIHPSSKSNGP